MAPLTFGADQIVVRVLGYRAEGAWVAHGLETDILGFGESFDSALQELARLTELQLSFSRFKGEPELLWKTADPLLLTRYEETVRRASAGPPDEYRTGWLMVPLPVGPAGAGGC